MKKIISILLTLTIICTFSACKEADNSSKYEDNFQIEKESKPDVSKPDSLETIEASSREEIKKSFIYDMNETLEQNTFSISNFKCAKTKKLPKWAKIDEFSFLDTRFEKLDKDNNILSEQSFVVIEYDIKNITDKQEEYDLSGFIFVPFNENHGYLTLMGDQLRYIYNNPKYSETSKDVFFSDLAAGEIKHYKCVYLVEDEIINSEKLHIRVPDYNDILSKEKFFSVGVVPDLESLEE